jgi:hypothetical protein
MPGGSRCRMRWRRMRVRHITRMLAAWLFCESRPRLLRSRAERGWPAGGHHKSKYNMKVVAGECLRQQPTPHVLVSNTESQL